jgi:hypothetical protein
MVMNDGGPAFPVSVKDGDWTVPNVTGLTIRDYFATKAMPSLMKFWMADTEDASKIDGDFDLKKDANLIARDAYLMADAMLAAREAK